MKRIFCIFLLIFMMTAGVMTIEYVNAGTSAFEAMAETGEDGTSEVLYILTEEGESGIRRIPYEKFHFHHILNWNIIPPVIQAQLICSKFFLFLTKNYLISQPN